MAAGPPATRWAAAVAAAAEAAAADIEIAVQKALADGYRTSDIYSPEFKKADTLQMTQAVIENIG